MVNPDPLARPSASRLAKLQSLRGTNSGYEISRFQLYQELREAKSKLRQLELELSLNKSSGDGSTPPNTTSNATSNLSDTPKSSQHNADSKFSKNLRLIGRGCGRSRSSNVLGSCTSTPKKW